MDARSPSQILVLRLGSIGDVLLATPLVRVLRRRYPGALLRFLVKEPYADLLRFNPNVDEVVTWPAGSDAGEWSGQRGGRPASRSGEADAGAWSGECGRRPATRSGAADADPAGAYAAAGLATGAVRELARRLRQRGPLWLVDLQASPRSAAFGLLLRPERTFRYRKDYLRRLLLVRAKLDLYPRPPRSIAERYFSAVAALGLEPDGIGLDLFPGEEARRLAGEVLAARQRWLAVAPGARWATKRWPPEAFAAAARETLRRAVAGRERSAGSPSGDASGPEQAGRERWGVAVLGSGDDVHAAQTVAGLLEAVRLPVLDLAGRLALLESAAVLGRSALLLSNDSGLMHVGAALGVPTVAVFGSTAPQFGFAPYRSPARVLGLDDLPCRPCTHVGRPACPLGHLKCLRQLSPRGVADAAIALLDEARAPSASLP